MIPQGVDAGALDFDFLAQRFPLAGGHIRAIVFHACLQSAAEGAPRALDDAGGRSARCSASTTSSTARRSLDQFGPYAPLVAAERTRDA